MLVRLQLPESLYTRRKQKSLLANTRYRSSTRYEQGTVAIGLTCVEATLAFFLLPPRLEPRTFCRVVWLRRGGTAVGKQAFGTLGAFRTSHGNTSTQRRSGGVVCIALAGGWAAGGTPFSRHLPSRPQTNRHQGGLRSQLLTQGTDVSPNQS